VVEEAFQAFVPLEERSMARRGKSTLPRRNHEQNEQPKEEFE
jgi:hypothetical protein